jgi:hypothetical protein
VNYWDWGISLCIAYLCSLPALTVGVAASEDNANVVRAALDNGLRIVIVRDPLAPVVTVEENYIAGGDETPPGFPGMAHAQEHMAFRGCAGLSSDQIAAICAQLGVIRMPDTDGPTREYGSSRGARASTRKVLSEVLHVLEIDSRGIRKRNFGAGVPPASVFEDGSQGPPCDPSQTRAIFPSWTVTSSDVDSVAADYCCEIPFSPTNAREVFISEACAGELIAFYGRRV